MKIAYTHDWLYRFAGAEIVLKAMEEIYRADIYTLFYADKCVSELGIDNDMVHGSFLQSIPGIYKTYKNFLPLYPMAFRGFDLSDYDIIISSSHSAAKGFEKQKDQLHICYCHTPMRYIWDMYDDYVEEMPLYKKMPFAAVAKFLRKWDVENSKNVDFFMANSKFVAERIKRIYKRDAKVVYPPVDTDRFRVEDKKEDYYLFVGRLINAYKKVDLVVEAFNRLGKKLIIVGDGDDLEYLKSIANNNIEFKGWMGSNDVAEIMKKAKALILPSIEDFGIVSIEAQACGTPVIAYNKGGAAETVLDRKTGILFNSQTAEAIVEAVSEFESMSSVFDVDLIRKNSERFSKDRFKKEFRTFVSAVSGIDL